jgi:hypothetical protein
LVIGFEVVLCIFDFGEFFGVDNLFEYRGCIEYSGSGDFFDFNLIEKWVVFGKVVRGKFFWCEIGNSNKYLGCQAVGVDRVFFL